MKADLVSNGNSNNKKEFESQEEDAKLASAQKEMLIKLFIAHKGNPNLAESWIIDSGATSTMMSRREWIYDYILFKSAVSIGLGDDRVINAVGSGSAKISMDDDGKPTVYELRDVYYVPNMGTNNLLSVTYMSERNYSTVFGRDECSILKGRNGKARKRDKLWILKGKTLSPTQESAHVARASINTWHRRLGHAMTQSINKLVDQSMVTGIEAETEKDGAAHTLCISPLKGKKTRDVIPTYVPIYSSKLTLSGGSQPSSLLSMLRAMTKLPETHKRKKKFLRMLQLFSHCLQGLRPREPSCGISNSHTMFRGAVTLNRPSPYSFR